MKIIPAIDLIEGKCVRLSRGDYSTAKIYNTDPLEVAKELEANGIRFLHLVDLDGAKSGGIVNYRILKQIAEKTNLTIDFGGGIKRTEDVQMAFDCGAAQITAGSVAAKNPELMLSWLEIYGPDKILLGADCIDRRIATNGWFEVTEAEVIGFIRYFVDKGIRNVICTDISKDGMLAGPAFDLYDEILNHVSVNLIASGGISAIMDLDLLKRAGCSGAIVGKAIYEGKITLNELSKWL